jgi:hypothetical protein
MPEVGAAFPVLGFEEFRGIIAARGRTEESEKRQHEAQASEAHGETPGGCKKPRFDR